ncbi:MAG: hypothetical protein A4E53_01345 [Pelotomaculum sp. PtaB.Bin104]|nr:MAG: hypothetical protein A4E53_01345 [Pelotomaculum sp. PtaB.Bin104]
MEATAEIPQLESPWFVTVLGRLAGVDERAYTGAGFRDVPACEWYSAYVEWASQKGIVNGYGEGIFGLNDFITREQMAAVRQGWLDQVIAERYFKGRARK